MEKITEEVTLEQGIVITPFKAAFFLSIREFDVECAVKIAVGSTGERTQEYRLRINDAEIHEIKGDGKYEFRLLSISEQYPQKARILITQLG